MSKLSDAKASDWDKVLPAMKNKMYQAPSQASTNAILEKANKARPFSTATGILDVGCGTGAITNSLIDNYHGDLPNDARIIASDFSQAMVQHVADLKMQKINDNAPLWDQVEILQGDAQELSSFEDGSLSHVLAGYMMFMLPDPRKGLKEAFRVLTTASGGGVVALTSWKRSDWQDLSHLIKVAKADAPVPNLPVGWASAQGVREQLEGAGFREVEVEELAVVMEIQKPDDLVNMIMAFPFVQNIVKGVGNEDVERAKEAIREKVKEMCPEMPGKLSGTALVGCGRK